MAIFKALNLGTTPVQIKASGGQIFSYAFGNSSAADAWIKFFDTATAPTVGTTIPVFSFYAPKGAAQQEAALQDAIFSNGIWIAATGGILDTDTTATTANTVVANGTYR